MADYSISRYGDALAEAADSIVRDGMAETLGDVDTIGHYALVTLAADDLADIPDVLAGSVLILRTDSQGFVDVHYGPAHPQGDPTAYRALLAEWDALAALDAGEDAAD